MSPFGDMKPDEMDAVFAALAAESRRRILDILKKEPGCNVNRVCEFFDDIGRVAVMKHLDVLEGANLVLSEKVGRERLLYFNPVPIHMIYDRWTTEYSAYWAGRLSRMKYRLENAPIQIDRKKGGSRG
jgi:DNA-binding transcriptional ArsR family regulator